MFKSIKKKAVFLTLTCALLAMGIFSFVSRADSFEITYTISGNEITITGYTGSTNKVDLPKILEELKADETKEIPDNAQITSIAGNAFAGCKMSEIVLPTSLKSIACTAPDSAFGGCYNLATVTFENGASQLEMIGYQAFYGCKSLSQMELPDTVTTIGYRAFNGTALTSVTIPASCTAIGDEAFKSASALTSLTFAEAEMDLPLTVGESAFAYTGLTSVTLPARINNTDGNSAIPASMFNNCTSLASVTLPDNCTSIGSGAFRLTALTTIQLPDGLKTIGTYAFELSAMQSIVIPVTVSEIPSKAFADCGNLMRVEFKGNPTIASDAFPLITKAPNMIFQGLKDVSTNAETYAGTTIPYQYTMKSLELTTEPNKMKYIYNEALDTTGLGLSGICNGKTEATAFTDTMLNNAVVTGYNKTQIGKQTITISYGGKDVTYEVINQYNMSDMSSLSNVSFASIDAVTYDGAVQEPELTLTNKINNVKLQKGTDYTVVWENNVDAGVGTAVVTVTGKGNYTGTMTKTFTIEPKPISDTDISKSIAPVTYTGHQIKPASTAIEMKLGENTLAYDTDYKITGYGENLNAGTKEGTVTIAGKGNYTGTATISFDIPQANLDQDVTVSDIPAQTYTGSPLKPEVALTLGADEAAVVLEKGTDYTVAVADNVNAGTATYTFTAMPDGNYTGTTTKTFTIKPVDIKDAVISDVEDQLVTGEAITPEVTVSLGAGEDAVTLQADADYEVSYANNSTRGTATITATGKGNYTGTANKSFKIVEDISKAVIADIEDQIGDGTEKTPEVTVTLETDDTDNTADTVETLVKDRDYEVSYEDNIAVGTATVIITGKGEFTGTASKTFKIIKKTSLVSSDDTEDETATKVTISLDENTFTYDGSEKKPLVTVTLAAAADVEQTEADQTDAAPTDTEPTVLEEGTDYDVIYDEDSINAGDKNLTISFKGAYYGNEMTATYQIVASDISENASLTGLSTVYAYTGSQIKPEIVVSLGATDLEEAVDYTVSYANNKGIGTATLKITGKGNYTGSITKEFKIRADVSKAVISDIPDQIADGTAKTPEITVTLAGQILVADTDYTVAYANNTAIGTATVTVIGKGNYIGSTSKTFTIKEKPPVRTDISGAAVSVDSASYTGYAVTPAVVVVVNNKTLVQNTDYTVSYNNNVNVGAATVTVTGTGAYEGTVSVGFAIQPIALTEANVSIDTDGRVCAANVPDVAIEVVAADEVLEAGVDYTVTFKNQKKPGKATAIITGTGNYTGIVKKTFVISPKQVVISSAKNSKTKQLSVTCKKESGVSGYEITISTSKNFKSGKTVKITKSGSYSFKNLKKNKTYYVRVRAYVKVDNKKGYGEYSDVKSIKIKK